MSSFVEGARFVIQWDTTRNRKLTEDLWMQKASGFMSQSCNAAQWKRRKVVICLGFCSINNATLIYIQLSDYQRPTGSKSVIWLTVIGLSLQSCFQLCFFMYEATDEEKRPSLSNLNLFRKSMHTTAKIPVCPLGLLGFAILLKQSKD